MKVSAKINRDNLYIFLEGEIDKSVAGELRVKLDDYLNSVKVKNVILNMKELTFMDSTGVGLIMGRYKNMRFMGGTVTAVHVNERIRRILTLSGVYKMLDISDMR